MIPFRWSYFVISTSSILSRSHIWWKILMNLGFCVVKRQQVNSTGVWLYSGDLLHCCIVSTSIKTLPDFIGLSLSSSAFAIPSIALFKTNAFKSSGTFLPAASMMRNHGHLLSSWFSLVWFEVWFEAIFLCRVGHHMWGNSGHNPDLLPDSFINTGLGISPMVLLTMAISTH